MALMLTKTQQTEIRKAVHASLQIVQRRLYESAMAEVETMVKADGRFDPRHVTAAIQIALERDSHRLERER